MKKLLVISLLAGLLWPSAALAWEKSCNGNDVATLALKPGDYACWTFNADADISGYLSVHQCENIDVFYISDTAVTNGVNTIQVWSCFDYPATPTLSNCQRSSDTATFDLRGDTFALSNIFGLSAVWLVIDVVDWFTPDTPEVIVKCNGPQGT